MNNNYSDGFFEVNGKNGFLPIENPLSSLPNDFKELQTLINELPSVLVIPNEIEKRVWLLPDYTDIIKKYEKDIFIFQALFRAYTFLTSAYTLELSYQTFVLTRKYGVARRVLPSHISIPLVYVSEKLNVYPWLDYHYAYSLGNYVKKDNSGTLDWKNLDMACKFIGSSDEVGFIMLHVYINELSGQLVDSVLKTDLKRVGEIMEQINSRRKEMWTASRHSRYNDFRIFIMGIKGNEDIFGEGLIYEGCFENKPQQFRGQTGAQDNIIPMMDIFTGIVDYYPSNQLTEYLLDLRTYRPLCIQNFFSDLYSTYKNCFIFNQLKNEKDVEGLLHLLKIVDEVYYFRNGHWQFVQKYIMENTTYPRATGGTPITSWLVNQIEAVLTYEKVIIDAIRDISDVSDIRDSDLIKTYPQKVSLLQQQVEEMKNKDIDVQLIYIKNKELGLEDI